MLTFSSKPRSLRTRRPHARTDPGPGLAPLSQAPVVADPMDAEMADDDVALKGWHDSSGELKRGLDVIEDVPLETLPADVRADFSTTRRR